MTTMKKKFMGLRELENLPNKWIATTQLILMKNMRTGEQRRTQMKTTMSVLNAKQFPRTSLR